LKKLILIVFTAFFCGFSYSANVSVRLVLKNGVLEFNDGSSASYKVFTSSPTFAKNSDLLIFNSGDIITLKVVNTTSENHGFTIDGVLNLGVILPNDSIQQTFTSPPVGVYRFFDSLNFPYNEYLGLSGVVHIKATNDITPYFYWDLREHQLSWNESIILGNFPILTNYEPYYFTINGNSEPNINLDTIARVVGNVGSEVRVIIVNNGLSIHSMHFHGYHAHLLKNSKNAAHEGREKDTFPVYPKEYVILSFVPDKPGEYPVHDHNLVAVTGGGIYHAGMFTTLLIAP
jgi:hypothetical protein